MHAKEGGYWNLLDFFPCKIQNLELGYNYYSYMEENSSIRVSLYKSHPRKKYCTKYNLEQKGMWILLSITKLNNLKLNTWKGS